MENDNSFICDIPIHLVKTVIQKHGENFITKQDKVIDIKFQIQLVDLLIDVAYMGSITKGDTIFGFGNFVLSTANDKITYIGGWETTINQARGNVKINRVIKDLITIFIPKDRKCYIKSKEIVNQCNLNSFLRKGFNTLHVIVDLPSSVKFNVTLLPNIAYIIGKSGRCFNACYDNPNKWSLIPGSNYLFEVSKINKHLESPGEEIECNDGKIVTIKDKDSTDYETFWNWLCWTDVSMELSEYIKKKEEEKKKRVSEIIDSRDLKRTKEGEK